MLTRTGPQALPRAARRRLPGGLVVLAALSALLVLGLTYRYLTSPTRLRRLVTEYVEQRSGSNVHLGSIRFSLFDGIELKNLSLEAGREPLGGPGGAAGPSAVRLFCPKVELLHDPLAALAGRMRIRSISAVEPSFDLIAGEGAAGAPDTGELLRSGRSFAADATALPDVIDLRDAHIRLMRRHAGAPQLTEELRLTMRARRSEKDPLVYGLSWSCPSAAPSAAGKPSAEQRCGHVYIDLGRAAARGIRGGLPPVAIAGLMTLAEPYFPGAAAWADRVGVSGTVRAGEFVLGGDAAEGDFLALELREVSASVPVDEHENALVPGERYLRFEALNGTLTVNGLSHARVSGQLVGRFRSSPCVITVDSEPPASDVAAIAGRALNLGVSVKHLPVVQERSAVFAEQKRFIDRWPVLARVFRDFDPHGVVDVALEATLQGNADPVMSIQRLEVAASDASVLCRYVPYPLEHVEGTIVARREGPVTADFVGRRKGANVAVKVRLDRPDGNAPGRVRITGADVPIDEALLATVPGRFRELLASWGLSGQVEVTIELQRPASPSESGAPWEFGLTATFEDLAAAPDALPIRLAALRGDVTFSGDRVEFKELHGEAAGGDFVAQGYAVLGGGNLSDLSIRIRGSDLLLEKLPTADVLAEARDLAPARFTGPFDMDLKLSLDPATGRVVHDAELKLKGVAVAGGEAAGIIRRIEGDVRWSSAGVRFDGVRVRILGTPVRLDGRLERDGERETLSLDLHARAVSLDRSAYEWLPEKLAAALADWRITAGTLDLRLDGTRTASNDASWTWQSADIHLQNATASHPRLPSPIRDIHTELAFDGETVQVPYLRAEYEGAAIAGTLEQIGEAPKAVEARFRVHDLPLDRDLRDLLPEGLRPMWERLAPCGSVDVEVSSLRCSAARSDGGREAHLPSPDASVCTVNGELHLHEVGLGQRKELRRITGTFAGSGEIAGGGLVLSGTLAARTATAWHRELTDIESSWTLLKAGEGPGRFTLDRLQAGLYGGATAARFDVSFDRKRAAYSLQSTWQNVDLTQFIAADPNAQAAGDAIREVHGRIDAHAYLSGPVGEPEERRGGGRVELRDGQLYRLPLIMAVLHVLNLSPPEGGVFEDAAVSFFVVGRDVKLSEIVLQNDNLALVGSGTMSLPDRGLDLTLVNAPTHALARVPILTDLLHGASRELMELHVTGPVVRPTVRARPLRALSDEIEALFQKRKVATVLPGSP